MTDFVTSTSNPMSLPNDTDWQDKAYARKPEESDGEIDLKNAFEWLLSDDHTENQVKERRCDLLIWLLNLELRLSPYVEEPA
ncbi:MAG: hypothetical protein R3C24_00245 [Cyanobacteriota/Melainabacteria group bacterium]